MTLIAHENKTTTRKGTGLDMKKADLRNDKTTSKLTWTLILSLALITLAWLLKPYWVTIIVSIVAAVLFNNVYLKLTKKFKGNKVAGATVTSLLVVLLVGVPTILITGLATSQAISFVESLSKGNLIQNNLNLHAVIQDLVRVINSIAESTIGNSHIVNVDQVKDYVYSYLPELFSALSGVVLNFVKNIPDMFVNLIIFFFVFSGTLVNQESIVRRLRLLSPFNASQNKTIASRSLLITRAMLKGQLLIAFSQGLVGAASLLVFGLGRYFLALTLVFTLMNLIPLGSGIILIPIGLAVMPFGFVWQGLLILAIHFLVTTNIDNFIRPKVVPKEVRMPAAMTILSAFAGIYYFGLIGVILGPLVANISLTIIEMYTDMRSQQETN